VTFQRFKWCNACKTWLTVEDILYNPEIIPVGLTILENKPDSVYFCFVHNVPGCGSSFLVTEEELVPFAGDQAVSKAGADLPFLESDSTDFEDSDEYKCESGHTVHHLIMRKLIQNRLAQAVTI